MRSHREALEVALGSRDLEKLVRLLVERVVWRGLPGDRQDSAGPTDEHDDDAHDHPPMCTSREEVREAFARVLAGGTTGDPVILAEAGDSFVVDPQADPPLDIPLHQTFTFRGGRIVLIQDFPDRASALADLG